ncbi:MAG: hypothetical protein ACOH5I_12520 [Oligoflexus sp.]
MKASILQLEKRYEHRVHLYRGELAPITIIWGSKRLQVQGCDLSTQGVGLIVANPMETLPTLATAVSLQLPKAESTIPGVVTHISTTQFDGESCFKVGVRFTEVPRKAVLREKNRFNLQSSHGPIIQLSFSHPSFFGRFIFARLINLSRDGLAFAIDLSEEDWITPTMIIDGTVALPSGESFQIRFEVKHSRMDHSARIFGCRLLGVSSRFSQEMAVYLLRHEQGPSVSQLVAEGFHIGSIGKALRFSYADVKEYQDVLRLRCLAAHSEGRLLDYQELILFADDQDQFARHLICRIGGKIVATARIMFPQGVQSRSTALRYGMKLPSFFWDEGFVELSHIAIDPDFQTTDICINILRHAARIALQNDDRYIFVSCQDEQTAVLRELGAYPIGLRYYQTSWEGTALNLMVIDAERSLLGEGLNPASWNMFSKQLAQFLIDQQQLHPKLWDRLRMHTYHLLRRPGQWWYGDKLQKRLRDFHRPTVKKSNRKE